MKKVVVLGGGVIGLSTAYFLAQEGHSVTVLDSSNMNDGCSYGNAGMVVPSHVLPLAQPGMISQGIRWMFNSKSPFYVKPRLSSELLSWGWQFYKHSTPAHVEKSKTALCSLSLLSKELYQDLAQKADFSWKEEGLLMLFRSEEVGEEEREAGKIAQELGLEVDFLSKQEVSALEPNLSLDVEGAVHYKSDAHLHPGRFMQFLKENVQALGVRVLAETEVLEMRNGGGKVASIRLKNEELSLDELVICAGAWSPKLAAQLGIKLRILPGKGYSFQLDRMGAMPTIPSILCEGKVAVTPYDQTIRFGGTMEITHTGDHRLNPNRIQGIVDTIQQFYPEMDVKMPDLSKVWHGFRPCTPSGLPYIGRSEKFTNVVIASGHAMMGLSLAPATGFLVNEVISGKKPSLDLSPFRF